MNALLGFALFCMLGSTAHATQGDLDVQSRPFAQQAQLIRSAIATGEEYSEISASDRDVVLALLTRIETTLGSAESVDALLTQARVDLFNDQEQVNAILTGAREDSRIICRRTQVTGSHRKQQVCATKAERDRQIAADRENLDRYRSMRTDPGRPLEP
ncbi:hypothetical protein E2F46_09240 [Luteimonas aestuarii]|uniref:Secreted protein n=1 Tax=Luteimonas aestuarii TaxID=453837 RepID=A0A4R5TTV4_9GAMM|nr:hypothetical protein [Luteimonas aestuarii]TDK24453.1 hypothetical protein E2F46_09240 [Luteimonas aestuarii]